MVLVTDGERSLILFSYGDIQWGHGAYPSLRYLDNIVFPENRTNGTQNIATKSNVGIPGLYIYRVDQEDVIEPSSITAGNVLIFILERID